jgi:hypothetical protein
MKIDEGVHYNGVFVSPEKIYMLQGKGIVASVLKEEVVSVTLKEGYQSERPFIQTGFGILTLLLSAYPLLYMASAPPVFHVDICAMAAFLPLGLWLLKEGMRRGYYLSIELKNGTRKLAFEKNCAKSALKEFIRNAAKLGYQINDSDLN